MFSVSIFRVHLIPQKFMKIAKNLLPAELTFRLRLNSFTEPKNHTPFCNIDYTLFSIEKVDYFTFCLFLGLLKYIKISIRKYRTVLRLIVKH